ncbi:MAG: TonB-dependent receptor [Bacteroidetes bacterium]|nr:TonB-dependent receptor [Bacteroidota bacterium]
MQLRLLTLLTLFICFSQSLFSQHYTQTIRGNITDKESHEPIIGALIEVLNIAPQKATSTDEKGNFTLEAVPVGRHIIKIKSIGYEEMILQNIIVNSGKETILPIEMKEAIITKKEVVISGNSHKEKANNELAVVSARSFSIDDANRYAGSLGDPARMASNFAGVANANDSRNDIIIRGNSPAGLLWRMEGIDIPSPNHFSAQGTTGGPISMLNNNMLRNSDFFTSAFPSEYGNAYSGVFDLKLRNGNNKKYEFLGQFGFNGAELNAEGPFSKKYDGSFLVSYRYSTLEIFDALGINIGPGGIPHYQDVSFKVHLPIGNKQVIDVFGIGGISSISLLDSKRKKDNFSYGQTKRDVSFISTVGVMGISHTLMLGNSAYLKNTLSTSTDGRTIHVDSIGLNNFKTRYYNEENHYNKVSLHTVFNKKFDARNTLRTGVILSFINDYDLQEGYEHDRFGVGYTKRYVTIKGNTGHGQFYTQWKHDFNERLTALAGVHAQYFLFNNTYSIEPRAGLKYIIAPTQSISFGYGLHGQLQSAAIYNYETKINGNLIKTNKNVDFTKSHHWAETYYQHLYNVPVSRYWSQYSMINTGADFGLILIDSLQNKGTGNNYGVELTLEKFFSHNYYFLFTTSLFNSKYKGYDGIERNTAYNSQYVVNGLAGKEFPLGKNKNNIITISVKSTYAGGRWYTPADTFGSRIRNVFRADWNQSFTKQFPAYFRTDLKIGFKLNGKKITQEWAVDLQNLTSHKNVLQLGWDTEKKQTYYEYQLGIFPTAMYRIQF